MDKTDTWVSPDPVNVSDPIALDSAVLNDFIYLENPELRETNSRQTKRCYQTYIQAIKFSTREVMNSGTSYPTKQDV